jgi:hypothetical protein
MKEVYPEYADQVTFYAVGSDPTEDLTLLEGFATVQGYPWPVAKPVGNMLQELEVLQRSTKIAFDANGVITYRASYGQGGPEEWRQVFQELTDSQ